MAAGPGPGPWQEAPRPPRSMGCWSCSLLSSLPEYLRSSLPAVSEEPLQIFPWLHGLAVTSKVPVLVVATK